MTLGAGMVVTTEIYTGKRRIISFFALTVAAADGGEWA